MDSIEQVEKRPAPRAGRIAFALECAFLLFLCAALVGAFHVWRDNPGRPAAYLLVVGVPATAALGLVLAAALAPDLLAGGRLAFPLNLTLPVVYSALLIAAAALWTTPPVALEAERDALAYAALWRGVEPILISATLQAALLSAIVGERSGAGRR